ncbi:ATP-binding protein [Flavobacterium sp. NRK1]|uniref:ATP-binding protein n=1 Tax=Flavobacterium sp. NRK1 TaxID=2954929 RepID=UPI002093729C|nr:ATP-binding protein [Flavobacterium sp. NRK1]MCO6149513.1 ATP-binding protein [Flavobacterium sp. NRK1]
MAKIKYPIPENEKERVKALHRYNILDTLPEQEFDDIAKLASFICKVPIAHVSFVDENRQWFKSKIGLDIYDMPREETFCQYAIMDTKMLEVPNAAEHEMFKNHPHVTGDFHIRFYAGVPLTTPDGFNVGTLCVVDTEPKTITDEQRMVLSTLAKHVIVQLELRIKNYDLKSEVERLALKELEAVSHELESYKLALDQTSGVVVFDKAGIVSFVNDNTEAISKYQKEELIGQHIKQINAAYTSEYVFDDLWKTISSGRIWHNEIKNEAKDGTFYWTDTVIVPIPDKTDSPYKYVEIKTDITNRKEVEQELIKAKEIAEKAVFTKDSFLANMSHEIRTPMNAIVGFADLLEQTALTVQQKDYIKNVKTAGDNLLVIINDILDLSKIESGKLTIGSAPFSLKDTMTQLYNLLKVKADEKNLKFSLTIDSDAPDYVMGDKGRINQILLNLTGNAIKFTENGEIKITVKKIADSAQNHTIKFSVKDSGIGIPVEKLDTIFERFTQAEESTTRKFGGTGLGLSIVKQLVELMQGEINVKSKLGEGSEFNFTVDFLKANNTAKQIIDAASNSHNIRELNILLCEDNPLNQHLAKNIIKGFGFTVDVAENGEKGLDLLAKNKYDIILMDLQMPVMDGYQTTTYIRNEIKSDIPIIAITAHCLIGEEQKCLDLGMNAYMSKPFKREELLNQIQGLIKR